MWIQMQSRCEMCFTPSLASSGKMSSIENRKRSRLLMSRYNTDSSDKPPSDINKTTRIGSKNLNQHNGGEYQERKKWLLWLPKIDGSLYPQLCKPARERETRCFDAGICSYSGWMWERNGAFSLADALDAAAAAADRRCRSRATEAIGRRRAPAYRRVRCPRYWTKRPDVLKLLWRRRLAAQDQREGFCESARLSSANTVTLMLNAPAHNECVCV